MGSKSLQSWYVCTQQFIRRRYMRPTDAASATPATHDKLTSKASLCNGLCVFATRFSLSLSPASNGSTVLDWLSSAVGLPSPEAPQSGISQFASSAAPADGSLAAASSSLR